MQGCGKHIDDELQDGATLHSSINFQNFIAFTIGGACVNDPFTGEMSYVLIYDRDLSESEVAENYEAVFQRLETRGLINP